MEQWDVCPISVTPVASLLSRCVSKGLLSQEELDSAPRHNPTFSRLQEVEQHVKSRKKLSQLQLESELLALEKQSADVTHTFYLRRRLEETQAFSSHLQEVLQQQTSLRQRLVRPQCEDHLPIQAHLHRDVVELVQMNVDFVENLDEHISSVQSAASIPQSMAKLNNSVAHLLSQAGKVETLSQQILQWKGHHSNLLTDSSEKSSM